MNKKKIITGILILLLAATGIFFLAAKNDKPAGFKTEPASKGDIKATVTATGTVNPVTTVLVGTQVSGTIKQIYVDFNSQVKKGQLLALIDPATFEAQANQARANLFSAKANLQKSIAAQVDAKRTMDRNRELLAKNLIAQSDFDTAQTNYESALAQVEAAKGQVAQTEAALKLAETNLRYTRILSPVNGTVISRNVDAGQTVAASFQTPTLFSIAQDLKKMQIDTSVNEADIGRVKLAQDVEFTVDAYPETVFKGKVTQIRIAPITVQNVVTYDVVISVNNQEMKLRPGMTANVGIVISIEKNALRVPNAALRVKLDKGKKSANKTSGPKGPGIWVLEGEKPKFLRITTGITDGTYTQVASGDLKEGQEVIVESLDKANGRQNQGHGPRMF